LALSTGARKGELIESKWQDIDLKKEVLVFFKTKNKEIRKVPIKGLILELLKAHRKNCPDEQVYIFKYQERGSAKTIERLWNKALVKAKIDEFRFHDLRHTAASYLAMNGASIAELAEVLGHKTLAMVNRYSHLSESHTANIIEKMNNKIFG
jgi:integrase